MSDKPSAQSIFDLYTAVRALEDRLRIASTGGTQADWEAISALQSAGYDLYGAYGALAIQEAKTDEPAPSLTENEFEAHRDEVVAQWAGLSPERAQMLQSNIDRMHTTKDNQ